MKLLLTATFLATIGFVLTDTDVASAFTEAGIVPDVVADAPTGLLEVNYGKKSVNLGNELTTFDVPFEPEIHYEAESDAYYTLFMIDPDVPVVNLGEYQFLHWLVANIPGGDISGGEVLAAYLLSLPLPFTTPHRYIFLLYKQPQGYITFLEDILSTLEVTARAPFSVKNFADNYNLEGPYLGNFFTARI